MTTENRTSNEIPLTLILPSEVKFSAVGLMLPEDLPEGEWAAIGHKLFRTDQITQWWIGDWAVFGAGNPDKKGWRNRGALAEFCRTNSIDYGNARNKAWVSGAVHLSLRRDNVSWSYFQELAPLPPRKQKLWLDRVTSSQISVAALRRAIRISMGESVSLALESEGQSAKLLTRFYDDFLGALRAKPAEFWNESRRMIWKDRIALLTQFADAL